MPSSARSLRPIKFQPLFIERIWGGRRLEELFGKKLPAEVAIGESWEIVDRGEVQSVVLEGEFAGKTLNELWQHHRDEVFGPGPELPHFPILVKLLDARDRLSVQVHPPADVAEEFGDEPKTEMWWIVDADPGAELYVGLRKGCTKKEFAKALSSPAVADLLHRQPVKTGDAMFLPSGRVHAIGGGTVIVEVQQNSDTTYRIYDWDRAGGTGKPRPLHHEEAMRSIKFDDIEPPLLSPEAERLAEHECFAVDQWKLAEPREAAPAGEFVIVGCLSGQIECAGVSLAPGYFFLVPAGATDRMLRPGAPGTSLLRITLPS